MVKKLIKHEIFSYLRVMTIVYGILLAISVFTRILLAFEREDGAYQIAMSFTWLTYIIAILAAMGFVTVLSIIRFYKNLFTGEGYLSFTLPITPAQHIWVKAIVTVFFHVVTAVVTIISLCIIMSGDALSETLKAAVYILRELGQTSDNALMHVLLYLLELIIILLVATFHTTLVFYTFISVGQLFNKNRIFAAIGAWFVHYILTQIIGAILTLIITLGISNSIYQRLLNFVTENTITAVHIFLAVILLVQVLLSALYFTITRLIVTKRLNLE